MKKTALLALSLFLMIQLHADSATGAIHIRVRDQQSLSPIVEATVKVMELDNEQPTDERGEAHIKDLEPGAYRLEIQKAGYIPLLKADVIVLPKRITFVEILLEAVTAAPEDTKGKNASLPEAQSSGSPGMFTA